MPEPKSPESVQLPPEIREDLRELKAQASQHVQPLSRPRGRGGAASRAQGVTMFSFFSNRPRLATAACVAVLFLAMTVIPVHFERTVGHTVAMSLAGPNADQDLSRQVAHSLEAALDVESVQFGVTENGGSPTYHLSARVPRDQGALAQAVVQAVSNNLAGRGIAAEGRVEPIKEVISGNLVAAAQNQVVEISLDDKTPAELEQEILSALMAAGIDNAQVSVTPNTGGGLKMEITAEAEGDAADHTEEPAMVFTIGGKAIPGEVSADNINLDEVMSVNDGGTEVYTMHLTTGGRTYTASVTDPKSLSDADMAATLNRQLQTQGAGIGVSVTDGKVEWQTQGPQTSPGNLEETTWGELKKRTLSEGPN